MPDTSALTTLRLAGSGSGVSSKRCAKCDISSGVVGVLCHCCQAGVAEGIGGDISEAETFRDSTTPICTNLFGDRASSRMSWPQSDHKGKHHRESTGASSWDASSE